MRPVILPSGNAVAADQIAAVVLRPGAASMVGIIRHDVIVREKGGQEHEEGFCEVLPHKRPEAAQEIRDSIIEAWEEGLADA